jgi:DNA-binding CsgD family transcriptional regulator
MVMVRDDPATWPFLISLFVAATAVILRRHWPITLLALSVLNTVVVFGVTGEPSPVIVAVVILLYTVAVTNEGRVTWAAGAISALVLSLTVPRFLDEPFLSVVTLAIIAWNAFAVGAGYAQRNRIAARRQPRQSGTGTPSPLLSTLTDREREVLGYVALGMSNDEIADHLHISVLTAKTHANRAMTKLNAGNRAQLVVIAYQSDLPLPGDG